MHQAQLYLTALCLSYSLMANSHHYHMEHSHHLQKYQKSYWCQYWSPFYFCYLRLSLSSSLLERLSDILVKTLVVRRLDCWLNLRYKLWEMRDEIVELYGAEKCKSPIAPCVNPNLTSGRPVQFWGNFGPRISRAIKRIWFQIGTLNKKILSNVILFLDPQRSWRKKLRNTK